MLTTIISASALKRNGKNIDLIYRASVINIEITYVKHLEYDDDIAVAVATI